MSFVRATSRVSRIGLRVPASRASPLAVSAQRAFSASAAKKSDAHAEETFEEFTARYDGPVGGAMMRCLRRRFFGSREALSTIRGTNHNETD